MKRAHPPPPRNLFNGDCNFFFYNPELWQPEGGGHVGFAAGWPPGHLRDLPQAVLNWLRPSA